MARGRLVHRVHRVGLVALMLGLALLGRGPAPARADESQVSKARDEFDVGAKLASEGRWKDALAHFSLSAALRPHAMTTYDIGFCERALGRATRARKFFQRARVDDEAHGQTELTSDLRVAIARYLAELDGQIVRIEIELAPPIATVSIDGRPLELAAPVDGKPLVIAGTAEPGPPGAAPKQTFWTELDVGAHEIVASWNASTSRVFHVTADRSVGTTLRLEPPALVLPKVDDGKLRLRAAFGVGIASVGLATIGVGVGFALAAASSWKDAKSACPDQLSCPDDRGAALSAQARVRAHVATALFVSGAAATASGLILYYTSRGKTVMVGGTASPTSTELTLGVAF